MKISVLITCYQREEYLKYHLDSILFGNYPLPEYEIIIINDGVPGKAERIAKHYQNMAYPVRYLFTGQRNTEEMQWRVPGFAFNIGIKETSGEIVVLSCAEMFHLDNSLHILTVPFEKDPKALVTPAIVLDDEGEIFRALSDHSFEDDRYLLLDNLRYRYLQRWMNQDPFFATPYMPYFMAIMRKELLDIGGYDEDFTGIGADDNDLTDRLIANGCHYVYTPTNVIHLHHPRRDYDELKANPRYRYNCQLWRERKGQIKRNAGKEWGKIQ